ncbi:TM2 domain-containing protein [Acidibrevibacterium fodinaquatile]|uniref:TM2 domain-containing protein n=1 Tax=Acidibrevibacterium fodinaquatile TaxID=1969806 RepID=UPI001F073CBD|nr:TM2 domain-containing protein [Acidibrevibacterium fodinaquatile]
MQESKIHNSDTKTLMRYDANKRSAVVAYLLWFFVGYLGAHRFYLNHVGSGVVMLIFFFLSIFFLIFGGIGSIGMAAAGMAAAGVVGTGMVGLVVGVLGMAILVLWHLFDAFLIPGMTREYNNRLIAEISN